MSTPSKSEGSTPKFKCSTCDKGYHRSSHLRRHEVTHTGQQSCRCPFCDRSFVKLEVARRHAKGCAKRRSAEPPAEAKRGRKARACDSCSRSKVSCDNAAPCARCQSRGIDCSYRRLGLETEKQRHESFLLTVADSSEPGHANAIAADAVGNVDEVPTASNLNSHEWSKDGPWIFGLSVWGQNDYLFNLSPNFGEEDFGEQTFIQEKQTQGQGSSPVRDARMEDIILQLASTYTATFRSQKNNELFFDMELAKSTFTAGNIRYFTWAHFAYNHGQIPIIHRPTFALDTTSPPLLLATAMAGSLYCAPTDHAISVRRFFRVVEEYIFSNVIFNSDRRKSPQGDHSVEKVEALQAALIITTLQSSFNDPETRRRIRMERHPCLVQTMRSLGMIGIKRRVVEGGWKAFVEDEMRVRLVNWTFLSDSHCAIFFNSPPQIALTEMTGDLPCREQLYEAKTASEFEQLVKEGPATQFPSLRQLLANILHGPWPLPEHGQVRALTVSNLLILISALQAVTFIVRIACLPPITLDPVLLATDRWKELWGSATQNTEAKQQHREGFIRHTEEVWWLIRAVIKAAQSGDSSCRYMQHIATDSLEDLHEFIRKYKG